MRVRRAAWASGPRKAVGDAPGHHHRLRQPARSASIGRRRTGPGNTSRPSAHTPSCATWLKSSLASGSGHDSSENSPLAPALRGDGGGLVPISRPQVPSSVPSFFSAPRCAACRPWTRRSTTPCLLRIDCRTSEPTRRRIHNGCPLLHKHANRGGRCTRWRRRIAAAASRLTCRCLRPASGESVSFRSKRCDTPTPRHPGPRLGFSRL